MEFLLTLDCRLVLSLPSSRLLASARRSFISVRIGHLTVSVRGHADGSDVRRRDAREIVMPILSRLNVAGSSRTTRSGIDLEGVGGHRHGSCLASGLITLQWGGGG
jgi:hypothetical protein